MAMGYSPLTFDFWKKQNKKLLRIIEANETKYDRNSHCKVLNNCRNSLCDWRGIMAAVIYSKYWVTEIVRTSQKQISVADKGF